MCLCPDVHRPEVISYLPNSVVHLVSYCSTCGVFLWT